MSKKQDAFYYDNFSACASYACDAAHYLEDALKNFEPDRLHSMLDELHKVEHAADTKKHELSNVLARAFITPIEREDIILLSQSIDEVVDKIEDVLLRMYCNNIQSIRPDALEMGAVLINCCEEMRMLINEFADFRHSKKLRDHIIRTLQEDNAASGEPWHVSLCIGYAAYSETMNTIPDLIEAADRELYKAKRALTQ